MKAIKIQNLSKKYKAQSITALEKINLEIKEGDFFAFLGLNGAGKSTLINCLTGLIQKDSGKIYFLDTDIEEKPALAKSFIGVVPQEFNFNIFEPVQQIICNQAGYYGIDYQEAQERSEILLKELEIWDKRKSMSGNLSGGMKRRLMIARALIHNPKILILDEPTAGVDIELRQSLWGFLKKNNKEKNITIILTTHYLEEAESTCNRLAIIHRGKIIENSLMKDFLNRVDKRIFILNFKNHLDDSFHLSKINYKKIDKDTIEVTINNLKDIYLLFRKLSEKNLIIENITNKLNRLESLFLKSIENDS